MKTFGYIVSGILFFLLSVSAFAQESCVSSDCHAKMKKPKFLHGPVAADQCSICHVQGVNDNPPKKHNLSYYKEGKALCLECHEEIDAFMEGKTKHGPIEDGECIVCHNPHSAENKFLLIEDEMSDLCFACHENNMTNQKYVHGPVAGGDCIVCHDPHASKNDFMLVTDRLELCLSCHEENRENFKRKHVHEPFKESCENCHTPHGSQFSFHLKNEPTTLCGECHKEFVQKINEFNFQHTAISKNGCLGCHLPHSSNYSKGLKDDKQRICFSCHEEMEVKIASSTYLHGPVKEGDCTACHNPHATNFAKHLVQFFPDEFYSPYKMENYAMCFGCHNKDVSTEELTTTLTDFRNGDLNLHFLHVNREKGRSCKTCHELHAGNQEKHIASEVPFGSSSWMLPINYTKTETGGGCLVGCHKEKEYDRVKPVVYKK